MPHEIFNSRFASHRQPAWHGLGQVFNRPRTAAEAFALVAPYEVRREPLYIHSPSRVRVPLDALVSVEPGGAPNFLGACGGDYVLVTPDEVVAAWDEATGAKVETIGALHNGASLFISASVGRFDIRGDEIDDYLIFRAYMDGGHAQLLMRAPVRPVCNNTITMAERLASWRLKIVHREGVREQMVKALRAMWAEAQAGQAAMREAFTAFAGRQVTQPEAVDTLGTVYPLPRVPRGDGGRVDSDTARMLDGLGDRLSARRDGALELWLGRGVGMDHPAAAGTAWGLYQAVVELEDYRNRRGDGVDASVSALWGERASVKARAFDAIADLVGVRF